MYREMRGSTVLFYLPTEIRTHGVGYYGFASEEDRRKEQLQMLNSIRDEVNIITSLVHCVHCELHGLPFIDCRSEKKERTVKRKEKSINGRQIS